MVPTFGHKERGCFCLFSSNIDLLYNLKVKFYFNYCAMAHDIVKKERTKDILIKENYNFDSLLLSSGISQGLKDAGFIKPSPIQLKAIPFGKCGLGMYLEY